MLVFLLKHHTDFLATLYIKKSVYFSKITNYINIIIIRRS
jgi:hypothetical protein